MIDAKTAPLANNADTPTSPLPESSWSNSPGDLEPEVLSAMQSLEERRKR